MRQLNMMILALVLSFAGYSQTGPITGATSVCTGATTTLMSGPSGGTWSSGSTGVATIGSTNGVVTGVTAGTANITYNAGAAGTATMTITVNPTPTAIMGLSAGFALCAGASTILANGTAGGTWTSSSTSVATIGSGTGVVNAATAGNSTITYALPTGCYTTQNFTVYPMPGAITGGMTVCAGATTTLAGTVAGGTWMSGSTGVATTDMTTGVVTGVSAGTASLTYTTAGGCMAMTTITVNAMPGAIASAPAGFNACVGGTSILTNTVPGGTWSSSTTGVATVGSVTGLMTGVTTGTTTITYMLPGGCYTMQTMTVNPVPGPLSGMMTMCAGSSTTLSGTVAGGTWMSGSTGVATAGSGTGIITGVTAGTAMITYTGLGGCTSTTTITVNPMPTAITAPAAGFNACLGNTTLLTNSTVGGTWSSSATGMATIGSTSGIVTGAALGTTNITYMLPAGCYVTQTLTVNAVPGPITGTMSMCAGSGTTLGNTLGGGTWTSGSIGTATIGSASGIVNGMTAGTAMVTYTTAGGCVSMSTITVNAMPMAIAGPVAGFNVCEGSQISVSNPTSGGTWTSSNSNATIGSGTGVVMGMMAGTNTLTYTLPGGCYTTQTLTVNAVPAPLTGTMTMCAGASTTLSGGIAGGTWTSGTTGVATAGSASGIISGTTAGTSTITYTTTGGCMAMTTITVNAMPMAITGPTAGFNVCEGSSVAVTNAMAGGTWSTSNGNAMIGSGTGIVSGMMAGTTTLSYTLPGGCYTTQTLTVNAAPAPVTGTMSMCTGTGTTLTGGIAGGTWTSGTTSVATVGSASGIVSSTTAGTTTITYTTTGGCMTMAMLTVNPMPDTIMGGTMGFHVCEGSSIALTNATTGGTWTSSTMGAATVGSSTGVVSGMSMGTTTITYMLPAGCYMTQTISTNPTPGALTGTMTMCAGMGTTLSATLPGGTWSSGTTGVATAAMGSGIITGVNAGTAMITYTTTDGCMAMSTVTVNAMPVISGLTTVCTGSTATLASTTMGGMWSSSDATIATIGSMSGVINGITTGVSSITYMMPTGCMATTTLNVISSAAPITGPAMGNMVCQMDTVTLFNTTPGGTWSSSDVTIGSVGSMTGVVTGMSAGTITVTYSAGGGCMSMATLTVNPMPAAITGASNVCMGSTITLANSSMGGTWSTTGGIATIGATTGMVTPVSAGNAMVTYTLPTGCKVMETITINPLPAAITGLTKVCMGETITLANTSMGGTWGTTGSFATVGASNGVVTGATAGAATITYTLPTGCYTTYAVVVSSTPCGTAVAETTLPEGVELYPNPATSELTVHTDGTYTSVVVTNNLGQVVLHKALTAAITTIDIRNLPASMYTITFSTGNSTVVKRFVKQ